MTVEELAAAVLNACDAEGAEHLVVGAFAVSAYGIPRSTKDVDVLLSVTGGDPLRRVIARLAPIVEFDPQIQFDTLTWGRRQVGVVRESPPLKVELFELFNDPFVMSQFARKRQRFSQQIGRNTWLPTPEDVTKRPLLPKGVADFPRNQAWKRKGKQHHASESELYGLLDLHLSPK